MEFHEDCPSSTADAEKRKKQLRKDKDNKLALSLIQKDLKVYKTRGEKVEADIIFYKKLVDPMNIQRIRYMPALREDEKNKA